MKSQMEFVCGGRASDVPPAVRELGLRKWLLGALLVCAPLSSGAFAADLATGGSVDLYSHVDYYPNPMIAQHAGTDSYNGGLYFATAFGGDYTGFVVPFHTSVLSSSGTAYDTGYASVGYATGQSQSNAGFGSLSAQTSVSASDGGYYSDRGSLGSAGAAWQDTWSFSGPHGQGYAQIQYSVTGLMAVDGVEEPMAAWAYYLSNKTVNQDQTSYLYASDVDYSWEYLNSPTGATTGTTAIFNMPVDFDQPNNIFSELNAYAYAVDEYSLTNDASSNFSATIRVLGVTDSSGNPISLYTLSADSGYDYTQVPEPSCLALLTFGGMGLLARRRKSAQPWRTCRL